MVLNGPKWFKMVQNGEKWSKSPKMVKIAKNGQNGLKSSKMVPNGLKWYKMVKWVTRPERSKGAKDEVKQARRAAN